MLDRALPAEALHPTWSSASALVYIGGFVVLGATSALLGILGDLHGEAAVTGYAALAGGLSLAVALLLEARDRAVAAGVAATLAVLFLAGSFAGLLSLIGLLDSENDGYQPATHLLEIFVVVAALLAIRRFRAPLLVLVIGATFWITVGDITSSTFSWDDAEETISLAVGAVLIAAGIVVDRSGRRPYGFWLHFLGAVAIGSGVLTLVSGDGGWLLVGVLSLVYVGLAYRLERSSYAVLGAVGILVTTGYFVVDAVSLVTGFLPFGTGETDQSLEPWQIALSFVAAGLLIGLLGLVGDRVAALRHRSTDT